MDSNYFRPVVVVLRGFGKIRKSKTEIQIDADVKS